MIEGEERRLLQHQRLLNLLSRGDGPGTVSLTRNNLPDIVATVLDALRTIPPPILLTAGRNFSTISPAVDPPS